MLCNKLLVLLGHIMLRLSEVKRCSSPEEGISEVWSVTCQMGSHSVTCHLTQMNKPSHNLNQTDWPQMFTDASTNPAVHG